MTDRTSDTAGPAAQQPSLQVLAAVADARGTEPADLDPSLHDAVDPEALDALFASSGDRETAGSITFQYAGYDVTVDSEGSVELC